MKIRKQLWIIILITVLSTVTCSLDTVADYPAAGTTYALIIGLTYTDLHYTKNDAQDMAAALSDLGVPDDQIFTMISENNSQIAKSDIMGKLSQIASENNDMLLTEHDTFIFHFSGHGNANDEFVLFAETSGDSQNSSISYAELFKAFESFPCPVIAVLDSCFSGGFIPDDPHSHDALYTKRDDDEKTPVLTSVRHAAELYFADAEASYPSDIWVMSAAGYHEQAFEPQNDKQTDRYGNLIQNGYFTHHLLRGLEFSGNHLRADRNNDGVLLLSELYGFVLNEFESHGGWYDHYRPHISGSPRDIVFVRY